MRDHCASVLSPKINCMGKERGKTSTSGMAKAKEKDFARTATYRKQRLKDESCAVVP